jgi:isopenicillin-N epimerase
MKPTPFAEHWQLDPRVSFLNHGSFGACPRPVLEHQQAIRDRMEREPVRFFVRELEPLLDEARRVLAEFLGADSSGLVFVTNVTAAINAVLKSIDLQPGDELLATNHEYNASRNALDFVADRAGARVIVSDIDFPIRSEDEIIEMLLDSVTPKTKLALIDHVTSQTAVMFPVRRIVRELSARGIDTLVDGAHAPGMIPLDLESIGAAYYAGNCHKWICAPKGAAFLHIREDRRHLVRPLSISHGANSTRTDRPRLQLEFDWTGTDDPSAILSVPRALEFMGSLLPGGWSELMQRNRLLALDAREMIARALRVDFPVHESMIGSMVALPLPDGGSQDVSLLYGDPIQDVLVERYGIQVPVIPWPYAPRRLLRISAQIYNRHDQYHELAEALQGLLDS